MTAFLFSLTLIQLEGGEFTLNPFDIVCVCVSVCVCVRVCVCVCVCCRQIKGNCAESFTEYWTCLDYSNIAELRRCRAEQKSFDGCVLDKLGWQRPDLGELSKVSQSLSTGRGQSDL